MARSEGADAVQRTAWYDKPHPTFSDALALVRKELWTQEQATCVHVLSKDSDRGGRIGRNTMLGLGL